MFRFRLGLCEKVRFLTWPDLYAEYAVDILYALTYRRYMNETKDTRIITPMPKALVDSVDEWRFENRIASRAEAIRQLLAIALASKNIKISD